MQLFEKSGKGLPSCGKIEVTSLMGKVETGVMKAKRKMSQEEESQHIYWDSFSPERTEKKNH